ncbi:MAG: sulfite reductase subunit alpha, partial [Planctomycetota bacterium]
TDYLYEGEIEGWKRGGLLTKLDLAFSRDQEEKIYVQHRMLENGAELWRWLEDGAYFYVCGDASRMAKDVEKALLEIVRVHGGKDENEASDYVKTLRKQKRYARDVY